MSILTHRERHSLVKLRMLTDESPRAIPRDANMWKADHDNNALELEEFVNWYPVLRDLKKACRQELKEATTIRKKPERRKKAIV